MTVAARASSTRGGRPVRRRRRRGSRRSRRIGATLLWLVAAVVVFVVTVGAGLLAAPVDFTPPAPPRPALIVDRNGKLLGEILAPDQRTDIPADQIPTVMRDAVVAAEDKRFYDSSGVDPVAILRAAISDLHGNPTQGGSTITQQYVKNVYYSGDQRSYLLKLKEAALAIRLEQRLSKQEILTRYLNYVYFGNDAYGVEAASEYYFGIHAKDLDLSQASMLAGLLPAPSAYNPVASLTLARERQMYVLDRMVEDGYTDAATASEAFDAVPTIVQHSLTTQATSGVAPEFTAEIASEIKNEYANDPDTLYRAGLRVQTTLDINWQQAATAALQTVLPKATDPEAAVVVVDYKTGDLLALANKTAPGYAESDPAETAYRTSGSTIKPFTLATALENGDTLDTYEYGPSTKTYPASVCPPDSKTGKLYTISNDEGGSGGYTLKSALAESVNTVYGPLAVSLGIKKVAAVAQAAGMTDQSGKTDSVDCSMGLGVNVTPLKEAYAYAALADQGVKVTPRRVLSVSDGVTSTGTGGQVISRTPAATGTQVIPAPVADQVVDAMRAVVAYGTATAAQQPDGLDVFGKTGTTDDETDAWFTGCLPAYTVCITTWMGYRNPYNADGSPHSMLDVEGVGQVFGGTLPAKIFATTAQGYRDRAMPVVAPTTTAPAPSSSDTAPRTTSAPVTTPATEPSAPATRRRTSKPAPPTASAPQTSVTAPPATTPSASASPSSPTASPTGGLPGI